MKKYYKINISLIALTAIIFSSTQLFAQQDRDPFSPSGTGVIGKVKEAAGLQQDPMKNFNSANPLTSMQLNGYKTVGILISDNQKIAAVKAVNGVNYLVKVGDSLGAEGGKISDINYEGITIQTESSEVKIPVSNKIEVPIDAKKAKN